MVLVVQQPQQLLFLGRRDFPQPARSTDARRTQPGQGLARSIKCVAPSQMEWHLKQNQAGLVQAAFQNPMQLCLRRSSSAAQIKYIKFQPETAFILPEAQGI